MPPDKCSLADGHADCRRRGISVSRDAVTAGGPTGHLVALYCRSYSRKQTLTCRRHTFVNTTCLSRWDAGKGTTPSYRLVLRCVVLSCLVLACRVHGQMASVQVLRTVS